ncbi:FecR family protein [Chitinophaga sp. YR627]|uniref:FecR family protein n=1 Tax=Chitinophaga sp. YR627 TaxID=1881041 RepID=UPI0008EF4574|nr:FecR domain-containing protein [Chitinophaga sp. YR627]SFM85834.1 FecR family protein [Chitinophaga sp. YR627]
MKQPGQHIINSLLEKHSLGILTPEERLLLEKWYADFPQQEQVWADTTEKTAMKDALKAEIFETIAAEDVRTIKPPVRRIWWQAAAVIAALAVISFLYSRRAPEYEVVTAAAGKGIVRLQLPDQSEMWLEPGTVVRYPKDFGKRNRELELEDGMAFFSVKEQTEYPFIVNIPGGVQAKVLGTGFTVKKYAQSADVAVMVNSGAVQVTDSTGVLGIFKGGQQLHYLLTSHTATRTAEPVEDWREGNLSVSDASFQEIARILENRYGLQVTFNAASVASYRFTLRINRQDTAADVLEMLKDISGLAYTLTGNKVIIQ